MTFILLTIIIVTCAALVFLILIQNSKGGGLSSNMGGAQFATSMMGSRKAADTVVKLTWYIMGFLVLLTFVANVYFSGGEASTAVGDDRNQNSRINTAPTQPMDIPPMTEEPAE